MRHGPGCGWEMSGTWAYRGVAQGLLNAALYSAASYAARLLRGSWPMAGCNASERATTEFTPRANERVDLRTSRLSNSPPPLRYAVKQGLAPGYRREGRHGSLREAREQLTRGSSGPADAAELTDSVPCAPGLKHGWSPERRRAGTAEGRARAVAQSSGRRWDARVCCAVGWSSTYMVAAGCGSSGMVLTAFYRPGTRCAVNEGVLALAGCHHV